MDSTKAKKITLILTTEGVRRVIEVWLEQALNCEMYVSKNARGERTITVIHDRNSSDLRAIMLAAKGHFIAII